MLRLDRHPHGSILPNVILGPQALEQLQAEIASKRVFDHLAVALTQAGGAHLHPRQL